MIKLLDILREIRVNNPNVTDEELINLFDEIYNKIEFQEEELKFANFLDKSIPTEILRRYPEDSYDEIFEKLKQKDKNKVYQTLLKYKNGNL